MSVEAPRASDGRLLTRRGLATRRRLLDVTGELLDSTPYRALKVVDIARAARTSPATFYQYFPDVEAAVLVLAAELAEVGGAELSAMVTSRSWGDDDRPDAARALAEGVVAFWDRHGALIGVLDLAALEGDRRFRELRTRLLAGVSSSLAEVAAAIGPADADPARARAVAGVVTSSLAHVAAHHRGLEEWGVPPELLRATLARVVADTLGPEAVRPLAHRPADPAAGNRRG